jgi:hypothetical protein
VSRATWSVGLKVEVASLLSRQKELSLSEGFNQTKEDLLLKCVCSLRTEGKTCRIEENISGVACDLRTEVGSVQIEMRKGKNNRLYCSCLFFCLKEKNDTYKLISK